MKILINIYIYSKIIIFQPIEIIDKVKQELSVREGFAQNLKRGTAHVFSVAALNKFLEANEFSHMIRAHELQNSGVSVNT